MNKSLAHFVFYMLSLCAVQAAWANEPTIVPPVETPTTVVKQDLPKDPKVNPDYPFKSTHRSKAPVRVYFSYFYLGGRLAQELNQLTVVTKERLTGANVLAGLNVASDAILGKAKFGGNQYGFQTKDTLQGKVKIGENPYDFQTRDTITGYKITDIVERGKLENPALNDIPKLLDEAIIAYVNKTPAAKNMQYLEKLTVRPMQWSLVFDDAVPRPEPHYILKFKTTVSKYMEGEKDTLFHKGKERGEMCSYQSAVKSLQQWQANDYADVLALRSEIVGKCVQQIAESLSFILDEGQGSNVLTIAQRIQGSKIMCKNEQKQCIEIAKDNPNDRLELVQSCKLEYKQCSAEYVKPLIDSTPIGKCKVSLNACKVKASEKANLVSPGAKPDRADIAVCVSDFKVCLKQAEDDGDKSKTDNDSSDNVDSDEATPPK